MLMRCGLLDAASTPSKSPIMGQSGYALQNLLTTFARGIHILHRHLVIEKWKIENRFREGPYKGTVHSERMKKSRKSKIQFFEGTDDSRIYCAAAGVGGWREVMRLTDCLALSCIYVFIFLSDNYAACIEDFAVDAFIVENLLKSGYWLRLGAASRSVCVEKAVHAQCQAVAFKGSSLSRLIIKVNDQNGKETQESEQHRPGPRMRWW